MRGHGQFGMTSLVDSTSHRESKICSRCGEEKRLGEFHLRKDGVFGRVSRCKECTRIYQNEHSRRPEVKLRKAIQQKEWKIKNKEYRLQRQKEYYTANKDRILQSNKKWKSENMDKILKHTRDRKREDVQYRLTCSLRSRLYRAISKNLKSGSAVRDLGCSIEFLKEHLEKQFYPHPKTGEKMTWGNYGVSGWHVDHIKPLTIFDLTKREHLLEACKFTNLQPLWAEENLKKSNKVEVF